MTLLCPVFSHRYYLIRLYTCAIEYSFKNSKQNTFMVGGRHVDRATYDTKPNTDVPAAARDIVHRPSPSRLLLASIEPLFFLNCSMLSLHLLH